MFGFVLTVLRETVFGSGSTSGGTSVSKDSRKVEEMPRIGSPNSFARCSLRTA